MKITKDSLILSKKDVINIENRLFSLSNNIFNMNIAKHKRNKEMYIKAWANVLFEACRIDMFKNTLRR